MNPFLRSYQYNYIKAQTKILLNGLAATSDPNVARARKDIAVENVLSLLPDMDEEQKALLIQIGDIQENADAKRFLSQLQPLVLPFPTVTEQTIKKLFPKAKKLKAPAMKDINLTELTYMSWHDDGTQRKYIIAEVGGKFYGFHGTFAPMNKKSVCALCNRFEEVGMFLSEVKSSGDGSYTKRGNYICQDGQTCNHNIISNEKLDDFVRMMIE